MKKLCLLLVAVVLLFSCTSCVERKQDSDANAYALYNGAKQLCVDGYEATVSMKMQEGEGEVMSGTLHVKVQGGNAAITRSNSLAARYLIGEIAYRSGYFYTENDELQYSDGKIKEKMTLEAFQSDVMSFFGISVFASAFPTFSKEALQETALSELGDYRSFSAELSRESICTYLGVTSLKEAQGSMAASFDKNGGMKRMVLIMHVTYEDGVQRAFELVYDFRSPGSIPAILPPTDANSYFDMT